MAAAQKIKEAEEQLVQLQEMAAIEREKKEIELERLRLENEKARLVLIEQRLETQRKQFEYALEFAGIAIDMVCPDDKAEIRPMLIQTIMNNILQLYIATGLEALTITVVGDKEQDAEQ